MEDYAAAAVSEKKESVEEEDGGVGKGGDEKLLVNGEEVLSKNAQKKLVKQQRYEAKKAEKKAAMKEQRKSEVERKRREWDDKLQTMNEEERSKLIESRRETRRERMEERSKEKQTKLQRLTQAQLHSHNIVIDLDFAHLMAPNQIHSLVQQVMYCYAVNGRCSTPGHLWLTGCQGEMETQLKRLPGFDKWIIEKDSRPYIETFEDRKNDLVYLTADSENVLEELDLSKIYIVGGIVDRNRWKGITMKKAQDQGIQTAKLPIGNYLKMCSSQVLTVNQVIEIILKFLETKDWKTSFFEVIPQRKRCEADAEEEEENDDNIGNAENEGNGETVNQPDKKRKCLDSPIQS